MEAWTPGPPGPQEAIVRVLEVTPEVLEGLLRGVPSGSPVWDARPDPERFTLREMLAHLVDMEGVWLERAERTCREEEPLLPDCDPDDLATRRDYGGADPMESLARFREARSRLIALLRSQPEQSWQRCGHRELVGRLTLERQAACTAAHDAYHTRQTVGMAGGSGRECGVTSDEGLDPELTL
jgi:hypothetical protein